MQLTIEKPIKGWATTNKGTMKHWPPDNYLNNRALSQLLADNINFYWADKGKSAGAHVVGVRMPDGKEMYQIRSAMVNGQPV